MAKRWLVLVFWKANWVDELRLGVNPRQSRLGARNSLLVHQLEQTGAETTLRVAHDGYILKHFTMEELESHSLFYTNELLAITHAGRTIFGRFPLPVYF
jgi:hypothetical protein